MITMLVGIAALILIVGAIYVLTLGLSFLMFLFDEFGFDWRTLVEWSALACIIYALGLAVRSLL